MTSKLGNWDVMLIAFNLTFHFMAGRLENKIYFSTF